jgi:4-amino-4-deoxy-L-arabinose transferase-like glycosyltransferase
MPVLLPALCFILIFHFLSRRQSERDLRSALLGAALVCGTILAALTEILSLLHWLTRGAVAAAWALSAAAWGGAILRLPPGTPPPARATRPASHALVPALILGLVLIGTGASAAAGWPNQWDSLVYHLPRVDHWVQNRTVAFYPTGIVRQLFNPPFAEYAILHLRLLGEDDRWSNAPQWIAMAGCLVGASAIARRFGATPRGQLFGAVVCATIPMGILQASGTQNDYVTAFWLVCMTEAALAPPSGFGAFRVGAGLGLALLSKGTTFLFAGPLLLLALPGWSAVRWRWTRFGYLGLAFLVAVAPNAPHWVRNQTTFGSPLGPGSAGSPGSENDRLTNEAMTPATLASNLIRNLSLHVGAPSAKANRALEAAVGRTHDRLGVAIDDPRTTRLYSDTRFRVAGDPTDPDRAGNPFHLLLTLTALALVAVPPRRSPELVRYALALAGAALLFCLVLKWQPWHSRLQLPLFVLAAPLVAVALEGYRGVIPAATLLLGLQSAPPLLCNRLAPLAGRHTVLNTPALNQYFQNFSRHPTARQQDYVATAELIRARSCTEIGLMLDWDQWEHPLWVLLPGSLRGDWRIEHVGVTNRSARLERQRPGSPPCAVVAGGGAGDSVRVAGRSYGLARRGNGLSAYLPGADSSP